MIPRLLSRRGLTRLGAAGLVVLAAASPATAQVRHGGDPCPPPYPPCLPAVPGTTVPYPGAPLPYPGAPEAPPAAPSAEQPVPTEAPETAIAPFLGPETGLAVGEPTVAVNAVEGGYIDPAPIRTRFRLRYDFAYGNNRPDRAEFFYAKCGCLATLPPTNPGFDPNAPGPPLPETSVDYQDIAPYLEVALTDRFSGFIEAPYRFLNPQVNENVDGFANIRAGARYGLIACPEQYVTLQLLADIPTGDADRGLGNDLVALEPGVLHLGAVSDRLFWMNEFRTWVPLDGTDFAGTVLRYGTGFAYLAYNAPRFRAAPVAEFVGWTVLGGRESIDAPPGASVSAYGDTIINAKVGIRFGLGELLEGGYSRTDLYIGYGRALTGEVWYEDIGRVDLRWNF